MPSLLERRGVTGRGIVFFALLALFVGPGCGSSQARVFEPDEISTSVEVETPDAARALAETLELPADPYGTGSGDGTCPCTCAIAPCALSEVPAELEALVDEIRKEAESRTVAAAEAVLQVGGSIAHHEEWREIVKEAMGLLDSPTIVVVQLPGGAWKKVKFEEVTEMDLGVVQIATIKNSVSGKMASTLAASMENHGIPEAEASQLADIMMETYLAELGY